ncbi:MAG TPA: acyl-CoA dehydrogenase family protein [Candidatus Eisenbacteria bacterium]|nr:acyl-CoA dehydrogenase family protein [Candidatus Eisenbacteria bacterium]
MDFALTPEQRELADAIRGFARAQLNDGLAARDEAGEFPRALWNACAGFGILGLPIPPEYGGQGQDLMTTTAAMEALGHGCRDSGLVFSLNAQMWACQMPILHYGSEVQKRAWLPKLVSGEAIGAHAITEPGAGSDVFALVSRATKAERGGQCGYVINGQKTFSTNAPVADVALAFAWIEREGAPRALTAFLVPRGTHGVTFSKPIPKMGLRTSPMGEVVFDDCFLPEGARLGPEGAGMAIFNSAMEWERACIFAAHLGAMQRTMEDCIAYARQRRQFGQPIAKFESVGNAIADMKVAIDAGRFLLFRVGWLKQQGKSAVMEAAIAKLFVSEMHVQAARAALQIFGGYGYSKEYPVERELRDALSGTIYSGTSEMQRRIIARCLGL